MAVARKVWQSKQGHKIEAYLQGAADASTRDSKRRPRASPLRAPNQLTSEERKERRKEYWAEKKHLKRDEKELQESQFDEEESEEYSTLSSRKQRLSRAARFGFQSSKAPIMLPNAWNTTILELLDDLDKAELRKEHTQRPKDPLRPLQSSILRLTTSSPQRYAAVRSVLRQVRVRLGPDEEDFNANILTDQWSPSRIVEYGCGTGEGLWASASVFRNSLPEGKGQITYEGYDSHVPYLRAAADIVTSAKDRAVPMLQGDNGQDDELANLAKMNISLRSSSTSSNIAASLSENKDPSEPVIEPTEGDHTLIFCNHALSSMRSDSARNAFVKSLWSKHPSAEVLAFVENGDERGFACIASAREELLGIGKQSENMSKQPDLTIGTQTFYAEGSESQEQQNPLKGHQKCHVVAPCPHDKPCPLLHDFELSESLGEKIGKSSRASSPLFHGASHGMNICATSTKVHNPEYTRKTRQTRLDVENANHCYLIVRKGSRPSFNDRNQFNTNDVHVALAAREELRRRADKTKVGILEALRSGSSTTKTEIPVAEEITSDEIVSSSTLAELGTEMEKGDMQARDELLRILPQILQNQAGEKTEDIPEALQMAQNVLEQSAQFAEQAEEKVEQIEDVAEESLQLASAMLEQQRELLDSPEADSLLEQQRESLNSAEADILLQEDIESMRVDAYSWPRLIIPPMKRSGHTIVDACTAQGSIDRFVLPKSLGKQMYQDARKVRQGDLLPYAPIEEKPVLWEELDVESGVPDESPVAMIEIQKIKTVMRRVPAALESQRNTMKPSLKIKSSSKRAGDGKAFIDWPNSSALAIGPDLVANGGIKESNDAISALSSSSSSRRKHYKEGGERALEQLEHSQSYSKRKNRKTSLADFDKEVRDAWAEDDDRSISQEA